MTASSSLSISPEPLLLEQEAAQIPKTDLLLFFFNTSTTDHHAQINRSVLTSSILWLFSTIPVIERDWILFEQLWYVTIVLLQADAHNVHQLLPSTTLQMSHSMFLVLFVVSASIFEPSFELKLILSLLPQF
jgi:hypothetical protein